MNRLADAGSRRRLFRIMAAGMASVPMLVSGQRSVGALGFFPADRDGDSRGRRRGGEGGGRDKVEAGCCCLLKGTQISTPAGERPIESLQIGDEVVTLSGPRPVKWIGYNKYTRNEKRSWQPGVMPIRIARSAIADQVPSRDLYLSPAHCLFINDVLIPAKYVVNGRSIAPAAPEGMTAIEYYHLEFDAHEVFMADGAPVESFMEEASEREYFSNFVEYERLFGHERKREMNPFAPVLRCSSWRTLASRLVDARDPVHIARDQLARRAKAIFA